MVAPISRKRNNTPVMLPNLLFFGLMRRPKNNAEMLKRAYLIFYWRRCRTFRSRLAVLKAFILSPLQIARGILKLVAVNGSAVTAVTGKSMLRQVLEQFYYGYLFSVDAENYYLQEFYKKDHLKRVHKFVPKGALKYSIYKLLSNYGRYLYKDSEEPSLGDKVSFYFYCKRKGVPVVPILMEFKKNRTVKKYFKSSDETTLPQSSLFVKPKIDKEGEGAEAWLWLQNGTYQNSEGEILSPEMLKKRLIKLAETHFSGSYLVQPLILPHPALALFRNKATPTIRIITYKDPTGEIKIDLAMLRFSINSAIIVDNASAGGLVAPIEVSTGILGAATGSGAEFVGQRWKKHRINGATIEGFKLPYWEKACLLVLEAHYYFPQCLLIGWDIIITNDGPVVLEGNSQPGFCYLQKANQILLNDMELGSAMAYYSTLAVKTFYGGLIRNFANKEETFNIYCGSKLKQLLGWLRIDNRISVRLLINGKVQGVFYRKFLKNKAIMLNVSGWVRNNEDGSVEAVIMGKAPDVEDLIWESWKGSPNSKVHTIEVSENEMPDDKEFRIIRH